MKDFVIWMVIWFATWGIFNLKSRWSVEDMKSKKYIPRGLYFLMAFLIVFSVFESHIVKFEIQIFTGFLLSNTLGLILGFKKNYYRGFSKDRFFLLFQSFNILFQQTAILVTILLLKDYVGVSSYKDIYFGLFFMAIHSPLGILPWAKMRYQLIASCFFGGWLFSYLILNFQYGMMFSFLIHYVLYIWQIHYLKDEEKI